MNIRQLNQRCSRKMLCLNFSCQKKDVYFEWMWWFPSMLCPFSSPEPLGLICNRPVALYATENTNYFIGWRQLNAQSKLKIQPIAHNILLPALSTSKHENRVKFSLIATILVCSYAIAVKKRIEGKVLEVSARTTSLENWKICLRCTLTALPLYRPSHPRKL